MTPFILQILFGITLLVAGGELLVRGAVTVAKFFKLSTTVIGLTIVAYGTSSPEMIVSIQAAASGSPDISLGNVIGSNIGNILAILALVAIVTPLRACPDLIKRDGWIMVGVSVLLLLLCLDGEVGRLDALILLSGAAYYTYRTIQSSKLRPVLPVPEAQEVPNTEKKACLPCAIAYIAVGLGLLTTGADILIDGSSGLARMFGVSDAVIGLTIVAIGTSTPELITSLVAAFRKQADLSIANIIGSNIFNILGIVGVSAAITPIAVSAQFLSVDLYVMIATALIGIWMLYSKHTLSRLEGAVLLLLYIAYIVYQYAFTTPV